MIYRITEPVWKYQGKAAWYFITLPAGESAEIRFCTSGDRTAWGSVRVSARIGGTEWATSLFPDSKLGCYVLPLKAGVRKKEGIKAGDVVTVHLHVVASSV